jgi:hypothetical protein
VRQRDQDQQHGRQRRQVRPGEREQRDAEQQVTTGDSSTLAITVNTMQRPSVAAYVDRGSRCGQASRISAMLSAARASTSPAKVSAKPSQDRL